jgi:steroid delta-isomerase-like uncharacterized protein
MDERELARRVEALFAAWNRHDAVGSVEMLATDCVFSDNGRTVLGRDAILARTRTYLTRFPDLRLELLSLYVASNTVLTEWRIDTCRAAELLGIPASRGNERATGTRVDEFGEDGLIDRSTLYSNTDQMLQEFGIEPVRAATSA